MLTEQQARKLMRDLNALRKTTTNTGSQTDILKFSQFENYCIDQFRYIVNMRTGKYKSFSNYDDLAQDGLEALTKAMKTYNPRKGSIFWWFHKYVETRIARSANAHTVIRFPLSVAKKLPPHRESKLPQLIETRNNPEKNLEETQMAKLVSSAIHKLTDRQKGVITLAFGFNGDKPLSINRICKKMNMSRVNCMRIINSALLVLKKNINL